MAFVIAKGVEVRVAKGTILGCSDAQKTMTLVTGNGFRFHIPTKVIDTHFDKVKR